MPLNDSDFRRLLYAVNRPWKGYRKVRHGIMKKIRRHMKALDCSSVEEYLSVLHQNPGENTFFQSLLLVSISRFFRDRQIWDTLKKHILPELLSRHGGVLRAWSAGCACGEEVYSLAILRSEMMTASGLKIIATDADRICLSRAQAGRYGKSSLKELSQVTISAHFTKSEFKDEYQIQPHLQRDIEWYNSDLLNSPPGGLYHLIFLRNNLLTYYCEPSLSDAVEGLVSVLVPGGFLIIGSHEKLPDAFLHTLLKPRFPAILQKNLK